MKIVFAGTPVFAIPALQALMGSEHKIVAVYTQPDRPCGRGRKLTASPVKTLALQHHLPVEQPRSLKLPEDQKPLAAYQPDVIVVVAYGLLLPQAVLAIPTYGCVNIHPSLLPAWRGATPIQSAILAGDKTTGVSIMQLDTGMDSGSILLQEKTDIGEQETSGELHDRLAKLGATLLLKALNQFTQLTPQLQAHSRATYSKKILKQDAELNWQLTAEELARQVRAYHPFPVAFTEFNQQPLRIWRAHAIKASTTQSPGTLIAYSDEGIDVATQNGVLRLQTLQCPGRKVISAKDFIHAYEKELRINKTMFGARGKK